MMRVLSPPRAAVAAVLVTAGALAASAPAATLGTIGPAYPITEPDLLAWLEARVADLAANGTLAATLAQARTRGAAAVATPAPVAGVTAASAARTVWRDPSVVAPHAVTDAHGRLLFAAGTRANPLAFVTLARPLLFIDARDARQHAYAQRALGAAAGNLTLVLVGGSPLALARAWRVPVYFDQHGRLTQRLGITHVPAHVTQDGARLKIEEIPLP